MRPPRRLVAVVLTFFPLSALGQDDDVDEPVVGPTAPVTGKAVEFDKSWLEPYFTKGPGKDGLDRFREEDWAASEAGFTKAVRALKKGSPEQLAAKMMLALARENESKWKPAGDLFEELYASYPRLATYHAYHAARCRLRAGDAAGALDWADKVTPSTVPEAETALVRVDALRALLRWPEVAAALDAYLAKYPNGPRRAEAQFKRGEAVEKLGTPDTAAKTLADATAIYKRVWAEAPLEAWADRAAERIEALASSRPTDEARAIRTHAAGEWVTRGMGYFNANRNVESEQAFIAALAAPGLDADLECRARFHRAQSVWKQRQRPRAAPLFDEADGACFKANNRDLHAKALYQGARCYASQNARAEALARYARVEAEHPDHSYADDARLRSAEIATDAGDTTTAAVLLADVPRRYPKGDLLNEALWRLAFMSWRAGKDEDALHWLDENLRLVPHEEIWYAEGRALYWKARVLERQGKAEDARHFYERAAREYPLSVYALLALTRLEKASPETARALVSSLRAGIHDVPAWTFAARPLFGDDGFLRAVELARMGQGGEARRELARLGLATSADKHVGMKPEDDDLLWITAILLDRGGSWAASHSIPRYGVTSYRLDYPQGLGEAKWKIAYPRAYPALVAKNAKANNLPEWLQLAIMREESAFAPRTESFANAMGLTQMIIKTAKRFSNGAPVTRDVLLDPQKNVEIGSRFLGFLWKRFGGTPPLTIAGYNAGESAVEKWLGERGNLATDEFMETIPYDETRNYTKRVLASYFAYAWLYGEDPIPTVPLALGRGESGKSSAAAE
ncbi:MAG TPA: transglycosylase SLT domain-containing protein [Polyangia bacterium]|nr:transglycosylase SLT domain-containing protein [Polyangia bacterium]